MNHHVDSRAAHSAVHRAKASLRITRAGDRRIHEDGSVCGSRAARVAHESRAQLSDGDGRMRMRTARRCAYAPAVQTGGWMASKRLKTGRNDHATKADVAAASAALRSDMSEMRAELRGEMSEMRAELRGEMSEMRAELRSEMRAQAVHFENVVVTQIRALGEVVVANAERHARELQEQDARLSARIDRLEDAVRQHSEELRALRAEVAGLRRDFEVRRDAGELRALEARVSTLESEVTRLKQRTGAR